MDKAFLHVETAHAKQHKTRRETAVSSVVLHETVNFVNIQSCKEIFPRNFYMQKNFASVKTAKTVWVNVIS